MGEKSSKVTYKKYRRTSYLTLCALLLISVACVITFLWSLKSNRTFAPDYESLFGVFEQAAVVSNAAPCATIGKSILKRGGNAVDSIIAAMLCDGVAVPQSMGLGGGFFMIIYNRTTNSYVTINARETAPTKATVDMFNGNSAISQTGGLAIAIPGEIKGYWTAYNKFGGGLSWKELITPTIDLCKRGIPVNKQLTEVVRQHEKIIRANKEFSLLFVNTNTGDLVKEGDTYTNLKLARTLEIIAENGGDAFYTGPLAATIQREISQAGGIITDEDLKNYEVVVEEPFAVHLSKANYTLHTLKPPSSGLILAYILRILDGILPAPSELLSTQRITEAFKYAYALRGYLGDGAFVNVTNYLDQITTDQSIRRVQLLVSDTKTWNDPIHYEMKYVAPEDHGTANLAVISRNGDAVVATSTINTRFGSKVILQSTGIIMNDEMDDFSSPNITNYYGVPPSPANFIEPGKRPMSSMCPAILTDRNGDVRLLIGGAGGTKITTAVAIVMTRILYLKENVRTAMDQTSFHHQLLPMIWYYYADMAKDIIDGMKKIGHEVSVLAPTSFAAVTAVQINEDKIYGSCDRKRPGEVAGY